MKQPAQQEYGPVRDTLNGPRIKHPTVKLTIDLGSMTFDLGSMTFDLGSMTFDRSVETMCEDINDHLSMIRTIIDSKLKGLAR